MLIPYMFRPEQIMAAAYVYEPLPPGSIRLFTLLPGPKNATELRGCLYATPFAKRLPNLGGLEQDEALELYEALSYAWGEPKLSHKIICNSKQICVTQSLFEALQQLRRPRLERTLWIDAICINQSDEAEKQEQIRFMRDIYFCAIGVTIWLGPADNLTMWALRLIDRASALAGHGGRGVHIAESNDRGTEGPYSDSTGLYGFPSYTNVDGWAPVLEFFSRRWFGRVWVVQELTMARSALVLIGDYEREWTAISAAAKCVSLLEALFVLVPVSKRPHLAHDIVQRLRILSAHDSAERLQLLLSIIVILLSRGLSPL
jgi:hypothetical protein